MKGVFQNQRQKAHGICRSALAFSDVFGVGGGCYRRCRRRCVTASSEDESNGEA